MTGWLSAFLGLALAACLIAFLGILPAHRRLKRAEYIRTFAWPPGLLDKLATHHKGFTRKETALVAQGLRQFFLAYLNGGLRYVAMPSQVADDLWHEFILYTRAYQEFCKRRSAASCITRRPSYWPRARRRTTPAYAGSGCNAAARTVSIPTSRRGCRCCSRSTSS